MDRYYYWDYRGEDKQYIYQIDTELKLFRRVGKDSDSIFYPSSDNNEWHIKWFNDRPNRYLFLGSFNSRDNPVEALYF